LNAVNWLCNVICPVGAGIAVVATGCSSNSHSCLRVGTTDTAVSKKVKCIKSLLDARSLCLSTLFRNNDSNSEGRSFLRVRIIGEYQIDALRSVLLLFDVPFQ